VTHDPNDPLPDPKVVKIHRIAGRIAVISAILALVMAIGVFVGMVERS
jgi:hypothetical protein